MSLFKGQSRIWTFTWFDVEIPWESICTAWDQHADVESYVFQLEECPDTKRRHYQGTIAFWKKKRGTGVQELFHAKPHVERCMDVEESYIYCTKEPRIDGPWQHNWPPTREPGKRTDLLDLKNFFKEGRNRVWFDAIEDEKVARTALRYDRLSDRLANAYARYQWRELKVTIIYGDAGVGKSRAAFDSDPNAYKLFRKAPLWFDGYEGQDTLIIDEFNGQIESIDLLELIDGHPYRAPVKGGSRIARWTKVFILSNDAPEEWWNGELTPQFCRRITECIEYKGILKIGRGLKPQKAVNPCQGEAIYIGHI